MKPIFHRAFKGVLALVAISFALVLAAEHRPSPKGSVLQDDGNGLPVVEVKLHSMKNPDVARTFRFILDTGAAKTILDATIPPEYFWDDSTMAAGRVVDATGKTAQSVPVVIKRLEVEGMVRDEIPAIILDLKGSIMGKIQDRPVDGILGMSFLRGTRFQMNPKEHQVEWWGLPIQGMAVLPLTYGKDERPFLNVKVDGIEIHCLVDTGGNGGINLPASMRDLAKAKQALVSGVLGSVEPGKKLLVPKVDTADGAWTNIEVLFKAGDDDGLIGQEVWSAGPTYFDFVGGYLGLQKTDTHELAAKRNVPRGLPIVWDRNGASPRLVVLMVIPGTEMEAAALKAGDVVVGVDGLKKSTLTRTVLNALLLDGEAHDLTVVREGTTLTLKYPKRVVQDLAK